MSNIKKQLEGPHKGLRWTEEHEELWDYLKYGRLFTMPELMEKFGYELSRRMSLEKRVRAVARDKGLVLEHISTEKTVGGGNDTKVYRIR